MICLHVLYPQTLLNPDVAIARHVIYTTVLRYSTCIHSYTFPLDVEQALKQSSTVPPTLSAFATNWRDIGQGGRGVGSLTCKFEGPVGYRKPCVASASA